MNQTLKQREYVEILLKAVKESINKRFADILSLMDKTAVIAATLDPHYKTTAFPDSDKDNAVHILKDAVSFSTLTNENTQP